MIYLEFRFSVFSSSPYSSTVASFRSPNTVEHILLSGRGAQSHPVLTDYPHAEQVNSDFFFIIIKLCRNFPEPTRLSYFIFIFSRRETSLTRSRWEYVHGDNYVFYVVTFPGTLYCSDIFFQCMTFWCLIGSPTFFTGICPS